MEKIENKGLFIPNIVCNSEISIHAKYLYGWIKQVTYHMEFTKSMKDIMNFLGIKSQVKARAVLKELKDNNFIKMYVKGNQRHIIPLVNEEIIILESKKVQEERELEEQKELYNQYWNSLTEEQKQEELRKKELIKKFYDKI